MECITGRHIIMTAEIKDQVFINTINSVLDKEKKFNEDLNGLLSYIKDEQNFTKEELEQIAIYEETIDFNPFKRDHFPKETDHNKIVKYLDSQISELEKNQDIYINYAKSIYKILDIFKNKLSKKAKKGDSKAPYTPENTLSYVLLPIHHLEQYQEQIENLQEKTDEKHRENFSPLLNRIKKLKLKADKARNLESRFVVMDIFKFYKPIDKILLKHDIRIDMSIRQANVKTEKDKNGFAKKLFNAFKNVKINDINTLISNIDMPIGSDINILLAEYHLWPLIKEERIRDVILNTNIDICQGKNFKKHLKNLSDAINKKDEKEIKTSLQSLGFTKEQSIYTTKEILYPSISFAFTKDLILSHKKKKVNQENLYDTLVKIDQIINNKKDQDLQFKEIEDCLVEIRLENPKQIASIILLQRKTHMNVPYIQTPDAFSQSYATFVHAISLFKKLPSSQMIDEPFEEKIITPLATSKELSKPLETIIKNCNKLMETIRESSDLTSEDKLQILSEYKTSVRLIIYESRKLNTATEKKARDVEIDNPAESKRLRDGKIKQEKITDLENTEKKIKNSISKLQQKTHDAPPSYQEATSKKDPNTILLLENFEIIKQNLKNSSKNLLEFKELNADISENIVYTSMIIAGLKNEDKNIIKTANTYLEELQNRAKTLQDLSDIISHLIRVKDDKTIPKSKEVEDNAEEVHRLVDSFSMKNGVSGIKIKLVSLNLSIVAARTSKANGIIVGLSESLNKTNNSPNLPKSLSNLLQIAETLTLNKKLLKSTKEHINEYINELKNIPEKDLMKKAGLLGITTTGADISLLKGKIKKQEENITTELKKLLKEINKKIEEQGELTEKSFKIYDQAQEINTNIKSELQNLEKELKEQKNIIEKFRSKWTTKLKKLFKHKKTLHKDLELEKIKFRLDKVLQKHKVEQKENELMDGSLPGWIKNNPHSLKEKLEEEKNKADEELSKHGLIKN